MAKLKNELSSSNEQLQRVESDAAANAARLSELESDNRRLQDSAALAMQERSAQLKHEAKSSSQRLAEVEACNARLEAELAARSAACEIAEAECQRLRERFAKGLAELHEERARAQRVEQEQGR